MGLFDKKEKYTKQEFLTLLTNTNMEIIPKLKAFNDIDYNYLTIVSIAYFHALLKMQLSKITNIKNIDEIINQSLEYLKEATKDKIVLNNFDYLVKNFYNNAIKNLEKTIENKNPIDFITQAYLNDLYQNEISDNSKLLIAKDNINLLYAAGMAITHNIKITNKTNNINSDEDNNKSLDFVDKFLELAYQNINKKIGEFTFPNGLNEYVYVGKMLDDLCNKRIDLLTIISFYTSISYYFSAELGNYYNTFNFAKRNYSNVLNDLEIKKIIALLVMRELEKENFGHSGIDELNKCLEIVEDQINTVEQIKNNIDVFATKNNDNIGSKGNPILVNGIKGVMHYIENNPYYTAVKYDRTFCYYLTDKETGVSYAIDEYTIYDEQNNEIDKIWFNIYGTENCNIYLKK